MVGAKQLVVEGRNGFIVPVECLRSLVEKMQWCIENRNQLQKMSVFARITAEQVSWARYHRQFAAEVKEIVHASQTWN
jgi:glycosyltransferase involved in cell wall biosynthesis